VSTINRHGKKGATDVLPRILVWWSDVHDFLEDMRGAEEWVERRLG
jgi:hypothetical protein